MTMNYRILIIIDMKTIRTMTMSLKVSFNRFRENDNFLISMEWESSKV